MVRLGLVTVAVLSCGCGALSRSGAGEPRTVSYELSSPDVGRDWHLHAKDGAFICELPCEQPIGEHTGDYLVIHDPNKSWRVDIPSSLPAAPGSRVRLDVRAGKGSEAIGTFGTVIGVGGAALALAGLVMGIVGVVDFVQCSSFNTATPCTSLDVPTALVAAGGVSFGVGLTLGASGVYLSDHNRGPSVHLRVTGISGTF